MHRICATASTYTVIKRQVPSGDARNLKTHRDNEVKLENLYLDTSKLSKNT